MEGESKFGEVPISSICMVLCLMGVSVSMCDALSCCLVIVIFGWDGFRVTPRLYTFVRRFCEIIECFNFSFSDFIMRIR